jgi:hypothetical protein
MLKHKAILKRQGGFSFNEVLVSISIVTVAVLAYSLSSIGLIRLQTINDNATVAIHLAQDKIEELHAKPILIDIDLCPSGGDRGISAKKGMAGVFDRCWKIVPSPLNINLKQIDVTVSWRDHAFHEVSLSTLAFMGGR